MLRKLVGYAAFMSSATGLVKLLTFLVSMMGAKFKTKDEFGNYATYVLVYGILQTFFISGVNQVVQKYAADDEVARRRFGHLAYLLFALLLVGGALGFLGMGLIFGKWAIALGCLGVPWIVAWWWCRYIFRSTLNARGESVLTVVASLGNSLSILALLVFTDIREALIYGDFVGLLVAGVAALVMIPKASGGSFRELLGIRVDRAWLAEVVRFGRPIWAAGQVFSAGGWAQGLMTRGRLGPAQMGELGVMTQLSQFIHQPMDIIGQAALPGLVQEKTERDVMYRELLRFCLVGFGVIGVGVAAGLPLVLEILDFTIGLIQPDSEALVEKYATVHLLLLPFAISTPFFAVEILAGQYAIAQGYGTAPLKVQSWSLVVILLVLWPLTESFGLLGILLSSGIGEAAKALGYVVVLWGPHRQNMRTSLVYASKATACCIAASGIVWYHHDLPHNWLLAFPAVLVFGGGMALFRLVHVEDFRRVWRAVAARGQPDPVTERRA